MTAFKLHTTNCARNALLAACAAITLGATAAHANIDSLAKSGYWEASQGTPSNGDGTTSCMLTTSIGNGMVVIAVNNADQRFSVGAYKKTWNIPTGTKMPLAFRIDGNPYFRSLDPQNPNVALGNQNSIWMMIDPSSAPLLVHELTAGVTMQMYFSGTEQPWTVSLSGTTGVWPAFMNCVKLTAPAVIASLTPTQPFVPQGPAQSSQPFSPAPSAPPAQPPSQPFTGV